MTVSGTSTFNLQIDDIIERAAARAFGEEENGYDLQSGNTNLGLLLQEIQVNGAPLWSMVTGALKTPMMIVDAGVYTLDASIVDVRDVWIRDLTITPQGDDLIVSMIPATTYNLIPNKSDPGRSYQYYLDKQLGGYIMRLYPVVDVDSTYALYARTVRRMYDVGDYTNTVDAPVRWLPTIISGLAWYIGRDNKKALGKQWVDDLKADYVDCYNAAANDDTDNSPTRVEPDLSAYFGN